MGLSRSRPLATPRGGESVVVLRQAEALDFLVGQPAVSTTTVYEGDALLAAAFLRERVALVVKLNPWLGGRLFWSDSPSGDKPRKLHLAYNAAAVSAAAEAGNFFEFVALDEAERLDAAYSAYQRGISPASTGTLAAALNPFVVPGGTLRGPQLVEAADPAPKLFRVSLHALSGGRFMLVTSLSHILGDGATYYALHCMLSQGVKPHAQPRALTVKRMDDAEIDDKTDALMGAPGAGMEWVTWFMSPGSLFRIVKLLLLGPKMRVGIQRVSSEWVAQQKAAEMAAAAAEGVAFVSTNDVIMAALARASQDAVVIMAVNLRGRVAGLGHDMAGNYENGIAFLREDADAAWKVRRSLSAGRLHRLSDKPLPGFFESLSRSCGVSLVSIWATFYHDVALPGAVLLKHMPCPSDAIDSFPMCVYVIYAPREGEVEIVLAVRNARITTAALLSEA